MNRYARTRNLLKEKEETFSARTSERAHLHRLGAPEGTQFEGQTKAKLGNVPMRSLVERTTNEKLAEWLEENPREANQVVQKATVAARRASRRVRHATSPP